MAQCRRCPFEDYRCVTWRFADDIDLLRGSEEEQQLIERLEKKTAAGYGMEISSDKSKLLVNSMKSKPSINIMHEWNTLEEAGPLEITLIHTNQRRNINKG